MFWRQECTHTDQIRKDVVPSGQGCEERLRTGDGWVHLRQCLICGHIGCCDQSVSLRACADRSWLSRRSAFPTVAAPCFPDQSPDDDDHLREGHPEVDHPPHPLRTPEELLVGVVP